MSQIRTRATGALATIGADGAAVVTARSGATTRLAYSPSMGGFNPLELARASKIEGWDRTVKSVIDRAMDNPRFTLVNPVYGPESITGSTRMKAGTAQKLVLNMLSTGAMIRLGKTYGNLMVDVKASNAKLKERALGIVMTIAACSREEAADALAAADGSAKLAVLHVLTGAPIAATRRSFFTQLKPNTLKSAASLLRISNASASEKTDSISAAAIRLSFCSFW